jgi:hypothetical protein
MIFVGVPVGLFVGDGACGVFVGEAVGSDAPPATS